MNRERKYRAWDGQKMHYDVMPWQWDFVISKSWHRCEKSTGSGFLGSGGDTGEFLVPGIRFEKLMDWSGLKDRLGNDIYEGDVYVAERGYMAGRGYKKKSYPDRIKVICVVEYSIYDAGWRGRELYVIKEHEEFDKNAPYHYFFTSLHGSNTGNAEWIEVIGNIYEHPHLLNQEDGTSTTGSK